jgi:hypothetical protein
LFVCIAPLHKPRKTNRNDRENNRCRYNFDAKTLRKIMFGRPKGRGHNNKMEVRR